MEAPWLCGWAGELARPAVVNAGVDNTSVDKRSLRRRGWACGQVPRGREPGGVVEVARGVVGPA